MAYVHRVVQFLTDSGLRITHAVGNHGTSLATSLGWDSESNTYISHIARKQSCWTPSNTVVYVPSWRINEFALVG